jgi:uncharacterized membrane protein
LEPQQQRREIYWKQTGRVTVVLMILWFVAGLGVHFLRGT